jgi:hypothetical protein
MVSTVLQDLWCLQEDFLASIWTSTILYQSQRRCEKKGKFIGVALAI